MNEQRYAFLSDRPLGKVPMMLSASYGDVRSTYDVSCNRGRLLLLLPPHTLFDPILAVREFRWGKGGSDKRQTEKGH